VVEGARLESDFGEAHDVIPKHFIAQSIQRLALLKCSSMWHRKRRCLQAV
jgi:hypothetical protein